MMTYRIQNSSLAWAFLSIIAVTGCAGSYGPKGPVPEGPPSFRQGYVDGCYSGIHHANHWLYYEPRKNQQRFISDPDYRRGWEQAVEFCYQEEIRVSSGFAKSGR